MNKFLFIVAVMIFYDFSIHLIYLLGFEQFFLKRRINYWPEVSGKRYQIFWTLFWLIALLLTLSAILRA